MKAKSKANKITITLLWNKPNYRYELKGDSSFHFCRSGVADVLEFQGCIIPKKINIIVSRVHFNGSRSVQVDVSNIKEESLDRKGVMIGVGYFVYCTYMPNTILKQLDLTGYAEIFMSSEYED